ncbi:hypothetical protein NIES4072_22770 [Nostoc commune NIES-4072]|uniref:Uncharacterized protein n=1 Tax=Nostoc commune NIES-4072 TaxID=2005467 RepID=A0A2R5FIP4_NOSCO|nr:hypothetical protein NIES4070_04030 [Nostoc commune HK-02]GBG18612.1 hypothetical protein NIES4072_22770 [Nostoc commune NIES-4072]
MMINCHVTNKKSFILSYLKTSIDIFSNFKKFIYDFREWVGITHPATTRGNENLIVRRENLGSGVRRSHSNIVLMED